MYQIFNWLTCGHFWNAWSAFYCNWKMATRLITAKHLLFQHDLVVQSVCTVLAFSTVAVTTSVQLNITDCARVLFTWTLNKNHRLQRRNKKKKIKNRGNFVSTAKEMIHILLIYQALQKKKKYRSIQGATNFPKI